MARVQGIVQGQSQDWGSGLLGFRVIGAEDTSSKSLLAMQRHCRDRERLSVMSEELPSDLRGRVGSGLGLGLGSKGIVELWGRGWVLVTVRRFGPEAWVQ